MNPSKLWLAAGAMVLASGAWAPAHAQLSLGNALDAPELVWTTGGTGGSGWVFEAQDLFGGDNTFDGVDSARSGVTLNGGESWLQTTVTGPGTISFWWDAYSEPDHDFLE